jgi:hypothetical protein
MDKKFILEYVPFLQIWMGAATRAFYGLVGHAMQACASDLLRLTIVLVS